MEKNSVLQIFSGTLVILVVAAIFILLNVDYGFMKKKQYYQINAKFNNTSGLSVGSKVRIRGVDVGKVASISLDNELEKVLVKISLYNNIAIPVDTTALISSESIFSGTKFIDLSLGIENERIEEGGYIAMTQSPLNLENLIKMFITKGT